MIKKLTLMSVLAVVCLQLKAQTENRKFYSLGDVVSDITFRDLLNSNNSSVHLSDFGNKFIIICFWGTHCGTCIKDFKKQDSLQNLFKKEIQIILVTHPVNSEFNSDSLRQIFHAWAKKGIYLTSLPVAVQGNEDIISMFPHVFVPHYVWIDRHKRLSAITSYRFMNAQTIEGFLQEKNK